MFLGKMFVLKGFSALSKKMFIQKIFTYFAKPPFYFEIAKLFVYGYLSHKSDMTDMTCYSVDQYIYNYSDIRMWVIFKHAIICSVWWASESYGSVCVSVSHALGIGELH